MTTPTSLPVYTQGFGTAFTGTAFISPNVPTASNITGPNGPFKIGQIWIDSTNQEAYILTALISSQGIVSATWEQFSSSIGLLDMLTGNTGIATPIAGNINVVGTGTITTTGSAGSLSITSSAGGFPITPFVVGPSGKAGYQTLQSAMNAANAAGGGMVYVQPGNYTENLTWFVGVYMCSVEPLAANASAAEPILITGNHNVVGGVSSVGAFGATGIQFTCTGNLFSSSLTSTLTATFEDCVMRATSGFVFAMPSLQPTSGTVFTLTRVFVLDGGTFSAPFNGNLYVTDTNLAINGTNPLSTASGTLQLYNSTINEPITNGGGITASYCQFFGQITSSGTGSVSLVTCQIDSNPSCLVFGGTSGGTLVNCLFSAGGSPAIDGNSSGTITITVCYFDSDSTIRGTLTGATSAGTTLNTGTLQSSPTASSVATASFGTVTFNTPIQNSLGYDVLVSGSIDVTAATSDTISMGVGISTSPTTDPITPTLTAATVVYFSAIVPNKYYLSLTGTGGITVDSVIAAVTPI